MMSQAPSRRHPTAAQLEDARAYLRDQFSTLAARLAGKLGYNKAEALHLISLWGPAVLIDLVKDSGNE